ncbi:MAG: hypothetical protein WKF34_07230 [Pyrinomonadaceae bacterium]
MNDFFRLNGILASEAFTRCGLNGEGIVEQIDGVINFEGHYYLVEMKWWSAPLGVGDASRKG